MAAVRANVRDGNRQISLATEDMFIWGQVHTDTPFYFPNREALLDLYSDVVNTPGVDQHILSHATIAPAVVDPVLIEKLSDLLIDKSPIRLPHLSTHPEHRCARAADRPGDGFGGDGEADHAKQGGAVSDRRMAERVVQRARDPEPEHWYPAMTLIVGNPGETDEDVVATLDLVYEVERRGLFAFFIPSIFTPLHDTRIDNRRGSPRPPR